MGIYNVLYSIYAVYSIKEHLYSKKTMLTIKIHITTILNPKMRGALMKPSPTPPFTPLLAPPSPMFYPGHP